MLRALLLAGVLSLGLAGCGGDTEGADCESSDDCDDGQVCAPLATCGSGESCPKFCGIPCETNAECPGGEVCADTTGSSPRICQDSRTISDF